MSDIKRRPRPWPQPKEYPATLSDRWTREIRELYKDTGDRP